MKRFVILLIFTFGFQSQVFSAPLDSAKKNLEVAVITAISAADFEAQVMPLMKIHFRNCGTCVVTNVTPYNDKGSIDEARIPEVIGKARSQAAFLYMHWNVKMSDERKAIADELKKSLENGFLVVGSAGMAAPSEPTLPLNRTLLGSVPGMIIVGDLEARERLPTRSYFGPEMLTAVRAPDEFLGKGLGSAIFVGRLASAYHRKSSAKEWQDHLVTTKAKTRRLWPSLDDFFGR